MSWRASKKANFDDYFFSSWRRDSLSDAISNSNWKVGKDDNDEVNSFNKKDNMKNQRFKAGASGSGEQMGVNEADNLVYGADLEDSVTRQVHVVEPVQIGQVEC